MTEGEPAPERLEVARAALVARGWPKDKLGMSRKRPDLGTWQVFAGFALHPSVERAQVSVWVSETGTVILSGEPLPRAHLRALVGQQFVLLRGVADLIVATAGAGRPFGSVRTGDPMETYPAQNRAFAPRLEQGPKGRRLAFVVRTHDGGDLGLAVDLDGDGDVRLDELPAPAGE